MAISRDTGSSFPIIAGTSGTFTSVTTGTFSTNNATTLIVVRVACGNDAGTAQHPVTVVWNGGTPAGASTFTKQVEFAIPANSQGVSIWTATASQTLSSASVTVTAANSANGAISVGVDALVGASSTITNTNGAQWSSSTATNTTLTSVVAGSWIFCAGFGEPTTTLSPVSNTTEEDERSGVNVGAVIGVNTTGTSGSIQVGWSTSENFGAVAGMEVAFIPADGEIESLGTVDVQAAALYYVPYTWFQQNAFQSNAFAILGGTAGAPPAGSGGEVDTLGLSDPQVSRQAQQATETDTLGASDPQTVSKSVQIALGPETLGFSESQVAAQTQKSSEVDTLGFSDPQVSLQSQQAAESDTLGFSDPQVSKQSQQAAESDTLGFGDAQVAVQVQSSAQIDTLGDTESDAANVSGGGGLVGGEADTLGFSDPQVALQAQRSVQIDVLGLTDQQIALQLQIAAELDTLGFSDSCAATVASPANPEELDTLGFGDACGAAQAGVTAAEQDTLGLSDSCGATLYFPATYRFFYWNGSTWVGTSIVT